MSRIIQQCSYLGQAIVLILSLAFFRLLPLKIASYIGGKLGEAIGLFIPACKIAFINLNMCYPENTQQENELIVRRMWNNLGRMFAEIVHFASMDKAKFDEVVEIIVPEDFEVKPAMFVSGHFGNFELSSRFSIETGLDLNMVYRPLKNPYADALLRLLRDRTGKRLIQKGKAGVRKLMSCIECGENVGILIDQKMNDGINIQFFGRETKVTPLPARLALKYKLPIYMTIFKRVGGVRFKIVISKVDYLEGDTYQALTQRMTGQLEQHIRESPEQWFWVHKRWDKKLYKVQS